MVNEGPTFQTANGNLSLSEFGELVSRIWLEAYPSVPMYPYGTATDDVSYPNITWRCITRRRLEGAGAKSRIVDEFVDDKGIGRTRKSGFYRCIVEYRVAAESPKEANQIIDAFERFMEQYAGDLKRAGVRELLYVERKTDAYDRVDGKVINFRSSQYEMHEETVFIESGPLIEVIQLIVRALRNAEDTSTEPAIVSTVDNVD